MSGPTWSDAGSQPGGPCREPLDRQDCEAHEWVGLIPLTDAELDDAIVRLVRLYPGRLGRPRIAHILAGHPGRTIKAKHSHLPRSTGAIRLCHSSTCATESRDSCRRAGSSNAATTRRAWCPPAAPGRGRSGLPSTAAEYGRWARPLMTFPRNPTVKQSA